MAMTERAPDVSGGLKKIGMIGGLAWPSTVDYYRLICSRTNAHFRERGASVPLPAPPMLIESINMTETRRLRGTPGDEESWAPFDAVFREAFRRLHAGGCEFGLIASNTPQSRLHAISRGLDFPIISIFDEVVRVVEKMGVSNALVLGTSVTMRAQNYPELLRTSGIMPNDSFDDKTIDGMQQLIDTDFYEGATQRGRAELLAFCKAHVEEPENTAILLACTELPLAFEDNRDDAVFEADGYRFVNTSVVHADAAFRRAVGQED